MYGANTTHASGNTVYTLDSINTTGTGYQAIWDTGGYDTIQHTGSSGAIINLTAATIDYSATGGGVVSHANGIKGGFTIANGVVIEEAIGGSGNDTITGNTAENTLRGNNGNDVFYSVSNGTNDNTIYGGGNNDVIYGANSAGSDFIYGGTGDDYAIITSNDGTFFGGTGTDTVRFVNALSNFLFYDNGSTYDFYNISTGVTFTVSSDVEMFQFSNGIQSYDLSQITAAANITTVDNIGVKLQFSAQNVYIIDAGGANAILTYNGAVASATAQWQAIHAEASGGGYKVLWKNADGTYAEWITNSAGAFIGGGVVNNVVDVEAFYGVDLNGDSTIGHTITNVETDGSTTLQSSTQGVYLIDGSISLTYNGANVGPSTFPGWQAIQTEASGGGYKVLIKNTDGSYAEWVTNATGEITSGALIDNVVDVETFYDVDLNGDSTIGHTITNVETDGSTTLQSSTQGVYLIDGSISLTYNGANVGPSTFPGWQAIQTEASGGGYKVLIKNTDGSYAEWVTNGTGEITGGALIDNVAEVETFYNADIDGSGYIGTIPPPKLANNFASSWDANDSVLEFISNLQSNIAKASALSWDANEEAIRFISNVKDTMKASHTEYEAQELPEQNALIVHAEDDFQFV